MSSGTKAVLLVGGAGLRLRPLTCNLPKPMVPILNRPFLEHTVAYLKSHHIEEVILALCYLPDCIQGHFRDGDELGIKMSYVTEDCPLGTAGAVKNVASRLDGTFFVFNGDIFTDTDLTAMLQQHRQQGATATIALTPVEDPTIYGVVETDTDGRVRRFVEKPSWDAVTSNMINAGIYLLEPEVLDYMPLGAYCMFEHNVFPALLDARVPFFSFHSDAYWIDIGTPAKYFQLHQDLLQGKLRVPLPGQRVGEGLWLDERCTVDRSAKVSGCVVLGNGCAIGAGARVVGPAVLGPGCTVGAGSVVERAVLWQNVRLGEHVTVMDAIVGNDSVIEDHAWVTSGSVVGDHVILGRGNRLEHGIRVSPGKVLEPEAISF